MRFVQLFGPADRETVEASAARSLDKDAPQRVDATLRTRDGDRIDVDATFSASDGTDGEVIVCQCHEPREADSVRSDTLDSADVEGVLDVIDAAVFLFSPDYDTLFYANDACSELYGIEKEQLFADPASWATYVHPADKREIRRDIDVQKRHAMNGPQEQLFRVRHPETGIRWLRATIHPIYDDSGDLVRLAGVTIDVTRQRRQERRLTVFHRILRHNLRNKLSIIQGYVNILAEQTDPEVNSELLTPIEDAVSALTSVSEHASRLQNAVSSDSNSPTPVSVQTMLDKLDEKFSENYPDVTLSVETTTAAAIDSRIELALTEALTNAIEHTEDPNPSVTASVVSEYGMEWVRIHVDDDGDGIPPIEMQVIQSAEETKLEHGSGFGLWFMDWVVEHVGGEFDISTNRGGGTRVEMIVPVLDSATVQ